MVEEILYAVIALVLFIIMFLKMIQKNDTTYVYIIVVQGISLIIRFISLLININMNIFIISICWIISIVLPIFILVAEKKGIAFQELICLLYSSISRDEEKTKKMMMSLIEKNPYSYYAHKTLATIYEKEKNYDVAAEEYAKALENRKNDYNLCYKMVECLSYTDKKDESIKILNDLLKQKPDYYEASMLLVDILYEQEKFKDAINICQTALKYKPGDYELYYNLGMIYTRLNDFQNAKMYYEKAAQINSLMYNSKYNLAQISLIYNDIEEAEKYFMECINGNYMEEGSYYYLAYIEMLKGNKQEAINYLNIAVEENKKYYDKAKKEIVFRFIIKDINKPTNDKDKEELISNKEQENILHLEKTYELVGSLNNNDIKAMETIQKSKEKEQELE